MVPQEEVKKLIDKHTGNETALRVRKNHKQI